MPILAGAGGAIVATVGAEKLGINPAIAAWGTAAIGAATALGTHGIVRQVATGVGAAGVCLGALQLIANARHTSSKKAEEQQKSQAQAQKRQAEADGYITRAELSDALAKSAEQQKQAQQQTSCDLLTAIRTEIKQVVDEMRPQTTAQPQAPTNGAKRNAFDDYERNAFGEDSYERNAYGEDWERNAFVVDEDYLRNAYGDDWERNAIVDEERNAAFDDERNAGDEERNAVGEEYGPN